jgi:hypothetical protein
VIDVRPLELSDLLRDPLSQSARIDLFGFPRHDESVNSLAHDQVMNFRREHRRHVGVRPKELVEI